ncbi:MAG: YnfA family protein [Vicinamibacterales bacterium]
MSLLYFCLAAFFEISGCFAFWMWLRNQRSPAYAAAGVVSLILFAVALTRVDAAFAGRAFAAYGGIYIGASLVWLRFVEGVRPDRWDLAGGAISIFGALVILFARR